MTTRALPTKSKMDDSDTQMLNPTRWRVARRYAAVLSANLRNACTGLTDGNLRLEAQGRKQPFADIGQLWTWPVASRF